MDISCQIYENNNQVLMNSSEPFFTTLIQRFCDIQQAEVWFSIIQVQ